MQTEPAERAKQDSADSADSAEQVLEQSDNGRKWEKKNSYVIWLHDYIE